MAADAVLSPAAQARMAAALPMLLGEVRARRRRRRAARAAVAVALVGLVVGLVVAGREPPVRSAPGWTIVPTDPTVLARCRVPTTVRAAWWLSDDDLRSALRAAERPDGLVRTGNAVRVHEAAVDAWPGETAEQ